MVGSIKLAPHFTLPNHHWQNFLCFRPRFPHCLIKFAFSFQRFQENVKLNNLPVKNMVYKGLIFEYFLVLVYFHELGKTCFRHKKNLQQNPLVVGLFSSYSLFFADISMLPQGAGRVSSATHWSTAETQHSLGPRDENGNIPQLLVVPTCLFGCLFDLRSCKQKYLWKPTKYTQNNQTKMHFNPTH